MIDLNNSSAEKLNNLYKSVHWKDQYSNLHPLYLQPGCKCDIKILFQFEIFNKQNSSLDKKKSKH